MQTMNRDPSKRNANNRPKITRREYLKTRLPSPYNRQAVDEFDRQNDGREGDPVSIDRTSSSVLIGSFTFSRSSQESKYWHDLTDFLSERGM